MAAPLSTTQLRTALIAEGLTVVEYVGWRDRCRCHTGSHQAGGATVRPWGPINGVTVHITAGGLGGRSVDRYIADIINGDPNTPCKAQFITDPAGTVWLNSAGRCNHAGTIGSAAVTAMRNASFSLSGSQNLRGHDVDGNTLCYGIENIAATSMTDAQRRASIGICAAICRAYGWTGQEVHGHGEASDQRSFSDPNLDMGAFRRDVMARVTSGPSGWNPVPTPTPKEPTVAYIDSTQVVFTDTAGNPVTVAQALPRGAWAYSALLEQNGQIRKELDALTAKLDALVGDFTEHAQATPAPAAPAAGPVSLRIEGTVTGVIQ